MGNKVINTGAIIATILSTVIIPAIQSIHSNEMFVAYVFNMIIFWFIPLAFLLLQLITGSFSGKHSKIAILLSVFADLLLVYGAVIFIYYMNPFSIGAVILSLCAAIINFSETKEKQRDKSVIIVLLLLLGIAAYYGTSEFIWP